MIKELQKKLLGKNNYNELLIKKLEKENNKLKAEIDLLEDNRIYLNDKIDKAIEYIEEMVSDTKGIIDTYNYEDKEETIKRYIEDLETDIKHYEYVLDILKGKENE